MPMKVLKSEINIRCFIAGYSRGIKLNAEHWLIFEFEKT